MDLQSAKSEYISALRAGQKELKESIAAGKNPHPAVLDEILGNSAFPLVDIGLVEVPSHRIIGVKSAGRAPSFSASFRPLLASDSEFSQKWVNLCAAHLGEGGIRDAVQCFEYLGSFYVQEGNKRVSVLRHFDAPRIPCQVTRVMPGLSDDPRIRAYYEFVDFYKSARTYEVQFRRPGDYAKLLAYLGKEPGQPWTQEEQRAFSSRYHYFLEAFHNLKRPSTDTLPEEALLLWLQVHPYKDLSDLPTAELWKSLAALWPDVVTSSQQSEVTVDPEPVEEPKPKLLSRIIPGNERIHVAFVHQLDPAVSVWTMAHEEGRKYVEALFGSKIVARSFYGATDTETAEKILEQAVSEGAQVIFTTAPRLIRATLKMAVKYPRVRFLNCSVDQPYSSVRTYYGRIYEANFITGAIAGAMTKNDRIGYIGSNPIFGVPASINAFALGAQLTNPRAKIELRWSCLPGNPQADFFRDGIRVVSNRDVPSSDKMYLEFCNYGTYQMDDHSKLVPLGSPVWMWGKFYEFAINAVLSGTWKEDKQNPKAVNYWLGMNSGVIDIQISDQLPDGVRAMAQLLRDQMRAGQLDPFARRILAQDGRIINDGSRRLTPEELLKMDWLCENVVGSIPAFGDILLHAQPIVRKLGIYRDQIPAEKESLL